MTANQLPARLPLPGNSTPPPLAPEAVLLRLGQIVRELPTLNSLPAVKDLQDQVQSLHYLTKKLRYDLDLQNAAAEAALWTKRRLGELLPAPQPKGGDRRSISRVEIETFSGKAQEIGLAQAEASRCVDLARVSYPTFCSCLATVREQQGELSTAAVLRQVLTLRRGSLQSEADLQHRTPPLPDGVFELLYADPPWEYTFGVTSDRATERHYPTMSREQLCALPVGEIAAPEAMLFLWATSPKLADALQIMEAWGFSYRSSMVWVKDGLGMGYYARINHEFLLIGRKGGYPTPAPSARPSSVIQAEKGRHSEKPGCVYALLERMYPAARKVELFARRVRPAWRAWGNEV